MSWSVNILVDLENLYLDAVVRRDSVFKVPLIRDPLPKYWLEVLGNENLLFPFTHLLSDFVNTV
jgi:hypothetical protein